jgi:hypothetical protein
MKLKHITTFEVDAHWVGCFVFVLHKLNVGWWWHEDAATLLDVLHKVEDDRQKEVK